MAIVTYDTTLVTRGQMQRALLKAGYVASFHNCDNKSPQAIEPFSKGKIKFESDELVCFCFEFTRHDIEQDYIKNGQSMIMAKIASEKASGGCDCAIKNPKRR